MPDGAPIQAVSNPMAAYVGRVIGNFRIEQIFGSGGMGTVFLARHVKIGTPAIVKVLSPELARDESAKRRFENEARLASTIQHPHIVRIYDLGEMPSARAGAAPGETDLYMVMEFVEGEDCEATLEREKRLDPLRAARILRQVASALDAAHTSKGGPVVHRDLKPGNIRLTRRGREEHAVVLDFGIAKAIESSAAADSRLTMPGMIVGTPRYISPEQARGDPIDGRTDIYSLGVVGYEMLAGQPPFQAPSTVQLFALHVFQPPPPFPEDVKVPPELQAIVMKCLEKEPEKRFQSAAELVDALDRFIASAEAHGRRSLTIALAAGLGAALVAVAAAWWFWREAPRVPIALASLEANGKDALGAEAIYLREPALRIAGRLRGLERGEKAEIRIDGGDGAPLSSPVGEDGGFSVETRVEGRRRLAVWLSARSGTQPLGAVTAVLDRTPPRLVLRPPGPGDPYAIGADGRTVYVRKAETVLPIDVADESPVSDLAVEPRGQGLALAEPSAPAGVRLLFREKEVAKAALSLRATDAAGNAAALDLSLVFDATPPRCELVEAPPENPGPRVRLRVAARDAAGVVRIELSGKGPGGAIPARAPDSFEGEVATFDIAADDEGRYDLRIAAWDAAGNAGEATVAFERRIAFQATFALFDSAGRPLGPSPCYTRSPSVRFEARPSKPVDRLTLTLDSRPVPVSGGGAAPFSAEVALARGARQALAAVVWPSGGGPPIERRWEIVEDEDPPEIALRAPEPWPEAISAALAPEGALAVAIEVKDASPPDSVTIRGGPAGPETVPLRDGRAEAKVALVHGSMLALEVVAKDRAGNETVLARRAPVDLKPPAIVLADMPRYRIHDRYAIRFRTDEPAAQALVDGTARGVCAEGADSFFFEGTMFLDTPLVRRIEVSDRAGNRAAAQARLVREYVCGRTGEPIPEDAVKLALTDRKAARCPQCGEPMISPEEKP